MEQVMQHPWMQGEMPSKDEVLAEFRLREEKVKQKMEEEK